MQQECSDPHWHTGTMLQPPLPRLLLCHFSPQDPAKAVNHSPKFPTSCFLYNSRLCSVTAMGIYGHRTTPSPLPTSSTDPLRAVLPSQLTSFGHTPATHRSTTSLPLPCARTAPRSPSRPRLHPGPRITHSTTTASTLGAAFGQPCRALPRAAAPTELNKETHDLPPGRVDRRDGCQLRTPRRSTQYGTVREQRSPAGTGGTSPPATPSTTQPPLRSPPNRRSPPVPRGCCCPGKVPARPRLPGFQARPPRRDTGTRGGAGGSRPTGACAAAVPFVMVRARLVTGLCSVVFF